MGKSRQKFIWHRSEIVTRILIFELRISETNHHTKAKQYEFQSIQKIS